MPNTEDKGRQASIEGFANEHIVAGLLMKKYQNVVIGLKPLPNGAFDMYFIPTLLIAVWGTKSKGVGTIEPLKNNYFILENCKNKDLILKSLKNTELFKPKIHCLNNRSSRCRKELALLSSVISYLQMRT